MAHPIDRFSPQQPGDSLSQKIELPIATVEDTYNVESVRDSGKTYNGRGLILGTKAVIRAQVAGQSYEVIRLEPTDECDPIGQAIDISPAFMTRHDSGLFLGVGKAAMEAGFDAYLYSNEQLRGRCPKPEVTAANQLAIGDRLMEDGSLEGNGRERDMAAVSKSLVIAIKKLERLKELGRGPANIIGEAAVSFENKDYTENAKIIAGFVFDVVPDILHTITRHPAHIRDLAGTPILPWDRQAVAHTITSIPVLLGAEVGKSLLNLHPETTGHITLRRNDLFGDQDKHHDAYTFYERLVVEMTEGRHSQFTRHPEIALRNEKLKKRADQIRTENAANQYPSTA